MSVTWNLWHGCQKISAGCQNCYVYRADARHGRDSSVVSRTRAFDLPLRRNRAGSYKLAPGELVFTCFTSDFLLEDADPWREEAWDMMRLRSDLSFLFITKRIHRLERCLPSDWQDGWDNVHICCTVENQEMADLRMPILQQISARHKGIICEPLLGPVDLTPWLGNWVEHLTAGGESGEQARICEYAWILELRRQCLSLDIPFYFKQTGARLCKDGRLYRIPRPQQHIQALKAGINYRFNPDLFRPED